MTTQEKFQAAVNVIRSLPKHGAYQPSNDLMLRFYAYFKQATEGPNPAPKPAFWEVVKKAKWDAWTKLGNMSKEEAMANYVDELKKIVETMSYTDNVANFVQSLDSFYESVPAEDLELLIGPVIERVRSQPGSPLSRSPIGSREVSPLRNERKNGSKIQTKTNLNASPHSSYSTSPLPPESDDEEEAFLDTVEVNTDSASVKENCNRKKVESKYVNNVANLSNVETIVHYQPQLSEPSANKSFSGWKKEYSIDSLNASQTKTLPLLGGSEANSDFKIIRNTVTSIQRDVESLQAKIKHLESSVNLLKGRKRTKGWPMNIPTSSFTFLLVWPIAVHLIFLWFQRKNLRNRR